MAMKLLAVLAFAGGVAQAETPRVAGRDGAQPRAQPSEPTPAQVEAVRELGHKLLAMVSSAEPPAQPRQLRGRPACGNVASRAPRPRDCP